jgi:hypothetical protein
MRTTRAIQISFPASLRQYYRCTLMRCGVWNGVIAESFWRAQARIRALLFGRLGYVYSPTLSAFGPSLCPRCHSQIQILTYPCTYIYETTNFLSGVSRGLSTILYCCRHVSSSSRCGTQRFVIISLHLEVSTAKLIPSLVPSSEPSMPIRRRSQHLLGYLMDQGSFQLLRIERSTYG